MTHKPLRETLEQAKAQYKDWAKFRKYNDPVDANFQQTSYMYGWLQSAYNKLYEDYQKLNTLGPQTKGIKGLWHAAVRLLSRAKKAAGHREHKTN